MFAAYGRAIAESSVTFVSQALMQKSGKLELAKKLPPVTNTRNIGKHSMLLNSATPRMEVNPETYEVRAIRWQCWPVEEILKNAPAIRASQFLVPPVLE
jgi:urease alpha subunit